MLALTPAADDKAKDSSGNSAGVRSHIKKDGFPISRSFFRLFAVS